MILICILHRLYRSSCTDYIQQGMSLLFSRARIKSRTEGTEGGGVLRHVNTWLHVCWQSFSQIPFPGSQNIQAAETCFYGVSKLQTKPNQWSGPEGEICFEQICRLTVTVFNHRQGAATAEVSMQTIPQKHHFRGLKLWKLADNTKNLLLLLSRQGLCHYRHLKLRRAFTVMNHRSKLKLSWKEY